MPLGGTAEILSFFLTFPLEIGRRVFVNGFFNSVFSCLAWANVLDVFPVVALFIGIAKQAVIVIEVVHIVQVIFIFVEETTEFTCSNMVGRRIASK